MDKGRGVEKGLFLTVEGHFSPAGISFSNRGVLEKNTLKNILHKDERNTRDSSSTQKFKINNLHDLKVAFLMKKRARTWRSTITSKILTRSAKKLSDAGRPQQYREKSRHSLPQQLMS